MYVKPASILHAVYNITLPVTSHLPSDYLVFYIVCCNMALSLRVPNLQCPVRARCITAYPRSSSN